MVGPIAVAWWGSFLEESPRLPARWSQPPRGGGEVEPTDLELECYIHLVLHEQARLGGVELQMLADRCAFLDGVPTAAAVAVEADPTVTLIGWCPGLSWHWPDENMPKEMARKFAAR